MAPSWRKIVRGALFAIIMTVLALYTIRAGATLNMIYLSSLAIVGMMLVWGVDIEKVKLGPMEIWFESDTNYEEEHYTREVPDRPEDRGDG